MVVENPVVITENELFELAKQARGRITAIYLHWTAGHYGQVFDDYHLCIDQDGTVYATCDDLCERKAHTWMRNNGTIGIALCCGYDAECELPTPSAPRRRGVLRAPANTGIRIRPWWMGERNRLRRFRSKYWPRSWPFSARRCGFPTVPNG